MPIMVKAFSIQTDPAGWRQRIPPSVHSPQGSVRRREKPISWLSSLSPHVHRERDTPQDRWMVNGVIKFLPWPVRSLLV
jgi:hypothetical protein